MGFQGTTAGAAYAGELAGAAVHRFDTGLHVALRTAIRRAVVHRLATTPTGNGRPMARAGGGYVVTIRDLPCRLNSLSGDDQRILFERWQDTPSLFVALGRGTFGQSGIQTELTDDIEIIVYMISGNARGLFEGRIEQDAVSLDSPTDDPGIEVMIEHVREILAGQELGVLGVHELRPVFEDLHSFDGGIAIWEQHYTARTDISVNEARASTDVVSSIEADSDPVTTITELEVP